MSSKVFIAKVRSFFEHALYNVRGTPLVGTLKDIESKALETGISLHRGPAGEPGSGREYRGL
jgi:hypothetical protein